MPCIVPSQVVEFIKLAYPFAVNQKDHNEQVHIHGMDQSSRLGAIITLINQIPPELITLKGDDYIKFISCIEAIKQALSLWSSGNDFPIRTVDPFGFLSPVTHLLRLLEKCPDEFPSPSTNELPFIQEEKLRESIRLDISAANQSLLNGQWKAATVLAGSAIEALLLWSIISFKNDGEIQTAIKSLQEEKPRITIPKDKENWSLFPLINVSFRLNLIEEKTFKLCDLAKDFRNLIHPGKTLRLNEQCNRGTALGIISALEFVVSDLKK